MRSAKVDYFYYSTILDVNKNVLGLQITMSYVLSMTIGNGLKKLLSYMGSFLLCELFSFTNLIEKLAAFTQFSHHINLALVLVDFVEAYDVRVSQVFEDVDFILQADFFLLIKL